MSNVQVISVHVPKTAGTTFRNLLMQAYGSEYVCCDYPGEYQGPGTTVVEPQTKVIHGHFLAAKYAQSHESAKRIVWLRHPLTRLISYYFYGKNNPATTSLDVKNMSLLEFSQIPSTQNEVARYLEGLQPEDFYFIGIQEYFLEDLTELQLMLDWPAIQLDRHDNQNQSDDYHAFLASVMEDSKLLSHLLELNSKDMALYEQALKFRAQRRQELSDAYGLQLSWHWAQPEIKNLKHKLTQAQEQLIFAQSRQISPSTFPKTQEAKALEDLKDETFLQEVQSLDDEAFVAETYRRYLKREADKVGHAYYLNQLTEGVQRQQIIRSFCRSKEFQALANKNLGES
jgi:hypothetical protein